MGIFNTRQGDGGSAFISAEDNTALESQTTDTTDTSGEVAIESNTDTIAGIEDDTQINDDLGLESLDAALTAVEQQIAEVATESHEPVIEQSVEPTVVTEVQVIKPFNVQPVFQQLALADKVDASVIGLQDTLRSRKLVASLSQVARDNNLSSPMVEAFHAVPGFDAAVESFPAGDQFNVVVEHKTSPVNMQGLEALSHADGKMANAMVDTSRAVVTAFDSALEHLGVVAENFEQRFTDITNGLLASDLSDEVLATLSVTAPDSDTLSQELTKLHEGLSGIESFNTDSLAANPEKVVDEVKGLQAGLEAFGDVIGASLNEFGLTKTEKNANYQSTVGTFESKNLTGASLSYAVSQSVQLVDDLKVLSGRREELVTALNVALENMPAETDGSDVVYGRSDHVTLLGSYAGLVNGFVRETTMALTTVSSIADAALFIDAGVDA